MVNKVKKSNTRFQFAIALFLLAIATPFLISIASSNSEQYWAISQPIPSGSEITSEDIKKVKIEMERNEDRYLTTETNLLGLVVKRSFLAGELVDVRYLSNTAQSTLEEVSIAIISSDIPMTTKAGDLVSIFLVPVTQNGVPDSLPVRILSGVFLSELDRKSSNFGNTISITLSLDQEFVPKLLAASVQGRLVVVGKDG
jgi:hypothetical protein